MLSETFKSCLPSNGLFLDVNLSFKRYLLGILFYPKYDIHYNERLEISQNNKYGILISFLGLQQNPQLMFR